MKKVICILLTITLMLSIATPVFAEESKEPRYGTLKVEYSNALGSIERLDVMINDDHVYADAVSLSDRLGYDCIQEGDLVSIYTENNFFYPNAPLLAVHFYVNERKVAYNPLFGAEYEYTAPAPCIVDENGVWVPLTYTLVLLGGNSTMLDDTLLIQMPRNNVLSIAATIVNNEDTLSFDWVSHFGYSEITTNVTDGAGRIVTLFSGLLAFDGDAWLSLIDWSAFDKKFGKSLATMFCTNSAEELQESIDQVELLLDVFSPEGKAGEMLRNKQIRIDSDVTAWKTACDEYLELLEQGSGSPTKYNMLYQQYERAVDDQSLFAALGGEYAIYVQNELSSAANVLDIASKVGSAVSYFKEFQQKDTYQISVLEDYLRTRTSTDDMPDATADAMMKYLAFMDSAGQYVFSRFLEENALELIVDKSGLDAYLGLPANILLFAWDIMSGTIPFYSEGLKAVENREISNYAQKMQNDALKNLKYLITELKKSSTISVEDCVQLSEYCYVYLKACYIARSSAIKSLDNTSEEFREQIKGKLDVEADINQLTIQYLAILSNVDVENSCYNLGFLPGNNTEYLGDYSDNALIDKVDYSNSALDAVGKQLSSVITYANGKESEEYHFTYNDLGQVVGIVAYRYEDGNAIKWYTQNYKYDEHGNLVLVEHGSSQSYHYQYDYDSDGRITGYSSIEYYEDNSGPFDTYIFSYDDQGRVIERRNEYGSSVKEFSYDESRKLVYESSELYWGDGHFVGKTEYDYTYAPLVITTSTSESKEYGNSSSKSISFRPHWNLTEASGTIDDSCSFDVDSSGYLLRVIDANGDNVYVCNYQEVLNDDTISDTSPEGSTDQLVAATYIPAIERVASNDLCSNVCGFLFDLDDDNVDELVLYYGLREGTYTIPRHTFDVYDVENGQLITRLEKIEIGSADVGGSSGNIGIEYDNGTIVLATYARNGWSSLGNYVFDASYEIKLYDCHTYSSARSISVDVNEHDSGYTITYIIDGKELSEDSFRQEIEQCKRIFLDDYESYSYVSWNYSATGDSFEQKQTVYNLLRYLQKAANISSESSPILTQKDAEDIAYSIWNEYLERTQGFDWKIFEEHSIIKDGVKYYCYTLNTNSRYGAEDWSIHKYLFVNSVTGEYDHTLY